MEDVDRLLTTAAAGGMVPTEIGVSAEVWHAATSQAGLVWTDITGKQNLYRGIKVVLRPGAPTVTCGT